jgi:hypothetical protein
MDDFGNGRNWQGDLECHKDGSFYCIPQLFLLDKKGKPYQYIANKFRYYRSKKAQKI